MVLTALPVILRFAALWLAVRRGDMKDTSSQHATRATRYPQEDIKVFFELAQIRSKHNPT
jgi:hypothetical protein